MLPKEPQRFKTNPHRHSLGLNISVFTHTSGTTGGALRGQDKVLSEHRGSSLIERYVDPNDPGLNLDWDANTLSLNLSAASNTPDLSQYYKFRVISTKKFAP
ncbi:MAG TPA: hypothetical protein VHY22_06810 [Chthoniobacteraceae bacterium]|jgi:hypothetical protein|nr:hypothetical protein [Chthoniobacteraceae bacterium]